MTDRLTRPTDTKWIRNIFGTRISARRTRNLGTRQPTNSNFKFADTTIGGNMALNPPPQSTRFADPKSSGYLSNLRLRDGKVSTGAFENEANAGSMRMGRFYSETHDDNAQYVHLRYGVPKYTGTIAFAANMYDSNIARLAKAGEYSDVLRSAGTAFGLIAMFTIFPVAVIVPLLTVPRVLKTALDKKPSKYYYLKPAMNLYLQALQAMLDTQLVHSKLVPMWDLFGIKSVDDINSEDNVNKEALEDFYSELPDIWKSNGKFDVYKMISRYQVLANYQTRVLEEMYDKADNIEEFNNDVSDFIMSARSNTQLQESVSNNNLNLQNLALAYADNPLYQTDEDLTANEQALWSALRDKIDGDEGVSAADIVDEQELSRLGLESESDDPEGADLTNKGFWKGLVDDSLEQGLAGLRDGAEWITFKIDPKSSVSDSFSNSTREPEISSVMNGLSSKARSLEVSASGGKTGFDFMDSVIDGFKSFATGIADSLHITGLAGIYGASYIDFPDVWDSSSAQVGTESFTFQLRSPFGNDLALFQAITVPTLALLAGAIPISTGKQSHTSPFVCEMYSRGRQVIRLGIIDSITINRGTGNMGWRVDGKPLGVDITVNIKDLSKVMHMPVIKSPSVFDDDNMYTDYMATLGAASLHELTYVSERLVINLNKWKQSWKSAFMSGRIVNNATGSFIGRAMSAISQSSARGG